MSVKLANHRAHFGNITVAMTAVEGARDFAEDGAFHKMLGLSSQRHELSQLPLLVGNKKDIRSTQSVGGNLWLVLSALRSGLGPGHQPVCLQ